MTHILPLWTLLLSLPSLAQPTGEAPVVEPFSEVAEAPAGSVLMFPPHPSGDTLSRPSLKVAQPMLMGLREPPSLDERVNLVPFMSVIFLRQKDGTYGARLVTQQSFLLPEPMYDMARLKARQLAICEPALDEITEETLRMANQTHTALSKCGDQFDVDEDLIRDLTLKLQRMETRALVGEDRLKTSRGRTLVAWAITGGLVLGASAAIVVSIAN